VLPSSPSSAKKEQNRRNVLTFYMTLYVGVIGVALLMFGAIRKAKNQIEEEEMSYARSYDSTPSRRVVEKDFSEVAHPRVIALGCYNYDLLRVGSPRNW
jgi:hypothetical protein